MINIKVIDHLSKFENFSSINNKKYKDFIKKINKVMEKENDRVGN